MSDGHGASPLHLDAVTLEIDGVRLIDHVTADFPQNACTVVLGPNGAGKSLLLRLCHGLLTPTEGRVVPVSASLRQAMVFDRPVLLRRSVAGNIRYPLRATDIPSSEHDARVDEALALAGLQKRAGQPATTLSAGQKQRLALARSWALKPDILFLDEPTAHLDLAATRDIERMITAIQDKLAALVMTTHDLAQARRLADYVLFVHKGRLLEAGPAKAFFEGPRSAEAEHFLKGEIFE